MRNRIRTCLRYLKFSTKKAKNHFLSLPCLFAVTFLPFHFPLWIHDIEITALGEFFSINFAVLCYVTSAINHLACQPACFLVELPYPIAAYLG